jgi:hypothetical protein
MKKKATALEEKKKGRDKARREELPELLVTLPTVHSRQATRTLNWRGQREEEKV